MKTASEEALTIKQLKRTYVSGEKQLTVLNNVSFQIHRGQSAAIVGPSGSGKTTLLGLCAGLDRPTSGSVHLLGHDLGTLDQDELAAFRGKEIGFVFQNFQLIESLTALENVRIPLELQGKQDVGGMAKQLLERVGLADREQHYPNQLSGGEQQRVALARAFINQPALLFADEPTGNLDGPNGNLIIDLLFEMNANSQTTLVLVTHDLELAARCDRTIHLRDGLLVKDRLDSLTESL